MERVPVIDRDALVATLVGRFPSAVIHWHWVNRTYRSWAIDIACGPHRVEVTWGPLSGFGATDRNNIRDDTNPFASFDWPLDSADAVVELVARTLGAPAGNS